MFLRIFLSSPSNKSMSYIQSFFESFMQHRQSKARRTFIYEDPGFFMIAITSSNSLELEVFEPVSVSPVARDSSSSDNSEIFIYWNLFQIIFNLSMLSLKSFILSLIFYKLKFQVPLVLIPYNFSFSYSNASGSFYRA